jgi:hypothetical protein
VFGAVQTGVSSYAAERAEPGSAGLLYALLAVGSATAGIAYAWVPARIGASLRYLLATAGLLLGTAWLATGYADLPVAITVAGVTIAPYMISAYALTERISGGTATGLMVVGAGGPVGTAVAQAVAGRAADAGGSAAAFLVAPAAAAVALVVAIGMLAADQGVRSTAN